MASQTLIWTTLPAGIRRIEGEWRARIAVFLTPRLEVSEGETRMLSAFAAFVDWPATLGAPAPEGLGFNVQVSDGRNLVAEKTVRPLAAGLSDEPDSTAWRRIFPAKTTVRALDGAKRMRIGTTSLESYSAGGVVDTVRTAYKDALAHQLGLGRPPSLAAFTVKQDSPMKTDSGQGDAATPLEQFVRFHQASGKAGQRRRSDRPEDCADFHRIVASLSTHPRLMRRLGLVLDFELPAQDLGLAAPGRPLRMRVLPEDFDLAGSRHLCPWTAVEYDTAAGNGFRVFTAAHEDGRKHAGLHSLGGRRTSIAQEKLEHAAFALIQHAEVALDADEPLPALLQGGMRLTQPGAPRALETAMRDQARLERTLSERPMGSLSGLGQASLDAPPCMRISSPAAIASTYAMWLPGAGARFAAARSATIAATGRGPGTIRVWKTRA